jgi:hypothetical protein
MAKLPVAAISVVHKNENGAADLRAGGHPRFAGSLDFS